MANQFFTPKTILTGVDALQTSGSYLKQLGSKALIVTDQVMVNTGNADKLIQILSANGIAFQVYAEVNSEPTDEMVVAGTALYTTSQCDFLIGLGGGSPIDAMKAIGVMATNPGRITDYMGQEIKTPPPNLVAIPTTAGTGSEATQFTIIADTKNKVKMLLKGAVLLPALAIVDPQLTTTTPAKVTAATGIDALTHAVEAYTSRKAQPLSDTFALSACKRIFANLRQAYSNGRDLEARNQMALAALEAGIAFNNSSVTIVHGMSRPIGALFHVPHGISNAMLITACLRYAVAGAAEKFTDIAKAVGSFRDGMSDQAAAEELVKEIGNLCSYLEIPTLAQYGVDRDEFFRNIAKMADDALQSGSPNNTIKQPTKDEIMQIYQSLWQ